MPYEPNPLGFFGPGYSFSSSTVSLRCAEATGVTTGTTFQGAAATDTLTTAAAHNLKVGDRVQVTDGGAGLPAELSAATDYWVAEVPTSTSLKLAATKGGAVISLTTDGGATNTLQAMGPLEEVSDAEGEATSNGDYRKVVFGMIEMLYQKYLNTPVGDRPAKMSITRSSSTNEVTGQVTRFYSFQFITEPSGIEVVGE